MIVGTAGHIDHGKTTLVRALTGVDTDRLPEEKARGMSIELGYAYLDLPDGAGDRVGFIDVPGHERLVHTMLAGATGIDFALLLVAADDGVMPQTREHVAVLSLLGVRRGAVALTKIDRVDASRVDEVRAEVAALLAATPLADAPVLAVSAVSGAGIDTLRGLIFDAARGGEPASRPASRSTLAGGTADDGGDTARGFRLAIDRSFILAGTGTVVTGTVHAGRVRLGDELALVPAEGAVTHARVRSLHAQNRPVDEALAGQRCAIGLAGVGRDDAGRGRWLVAPDIEVATDRLDALVTLWHDEPRPLRSGTPVHVHIGAGDTLGTVTVLRVLPHADQSDVERKGSAAADILVPGGRGEVQIVLRQPIAAWHGDRVVLRDASASRTLAGGTVLDPFAPARYRRSAQRLAELDAWGSATRGTRLAQLIGCAPQGVSLRRWTRAEGVSAEACRADAIPSLPAETLVASDPATGDWALGGAPRQLLASAAIDALRTFHAREPELLGPDAARLRRLTAPRLPACLWQALTGDLQRQGLVTIKGACLHLPAHGLRLSATDERLAQRIAPLLASAGFEGCWARDLARAAGESEALMRTTLARLAQRGDLHQVVKDLCYAPATIARLVEQARAVAATDGGTVTAGRFRDATGLGRKRAIQILEYFDRIGITRRVGDSHRPRNDSGQFPAESV